MFGCCLIEFENMNDGGPDRVGRLYTRACAPIQNSTAHTGATKMLARPRNILLQMVLKPNYV